MVRVINYKMFTVEQKRIFEGLKEIGEEISNFYVDAVRLVVDDCTIASKANLIAHLAREIDGGLRNVLSPPILKNGEEKFECKKDEEKKITHYESIIASLGKGPDDILAKEWFSVAKHFSKIAHRHGPWKESKKADEILGLWNKYEGILLKLVGSFYSITDRLDHIVKLEEPTAGNLGLLSNVLRNPKYEWHFFINLKKVKWIKHLNDAGYFNPVNSPKKEGNNIYPNEWIPIRFLSNAAKEKDKDTEKELIDVYKKLSKDYLDGKLELHPYTITSLSEILVNLDNYSFSETDKKFFEKFALANPSSNISIHESNLAEDLPKVYLAKSNKTGIKNILSYCFGFSVYYNDVQKLTEFGFAPFPQIRYTLSDHYLRTFVENYSNEINLLLGIECVHQLGEVIKEIHKIDSYKFSSTAIPSIEPSSQTNYIHEWEDNIVKFVVNGISQLSDEEMMSLFFSYLTSHIEIFRRIAFHIVREKFDVFKEIFFEYIHNQILDDNIPTHEPYVLLKEKSSQFSEDEFKQVINWIENLVVKRYSEEQTDKQLLQYKYYAIRKWLSSLNPAGQAQKFLLEEKLKYYDSLDQTEINHPEFDSYSQSFVGPDFPLTSEDFERKTLEEQVRYINDYEPKEHDFNSDEGLSQLLKAAVIKDPLKYIFKLDAFVETPSLYLHNLLDGFTKVLQDEKMTDFHLLMDFLEKRIGDESFKKESKKRYDYKRWFVSSVGTFMEALAKKDDLYNFLNDDLVKAADLLIALLKEDEYKDCDDKVTHDYITHMLNSTQGRLHMGLIEIAVTYAKKNEDLDNGDKWPSNVRDYFTNRLDRKTQCDKDFSIVLGFYFPNLVYFDKKWISSNLMKIFPKDNPVHFEYTLSSCLFSYSRQYKDVFKILKDASIIKAALTLYDHDCVPLGAIMRYALLEFCFWGIDLENSESTLAGIIEEGQTVHVEKLIDVTWESKFVRGEKLKTLWESLLKVASSNPEKYKGAVRTLSWFTDLIDELNDDYTKKLLLSINWFNENDNQAYPLMRRIYDLADSNLKNAGSLIFETLFKAQIIPFFDRELYDFVEKLYKNDLRNTADKICLYVGEKGQLTLKDLYDKYNA